MNEPMKKLFQFFAMAMMAVTLCNCGGSDEPTPGPTPPAPEPEGKEVPVSVENVSKTWQLTAWSPATEFPAENQAAYLELRTNGTFKLYQKNINYTGVVFFIGDYTLDAEAKTITGTYSDGVKWASTYSITSMKDNSMQWTVGSEVSTFEIASEVPAEIADIAIPVKDARSEVAFRLL